VPSKGRAGRLRLYVSVSCCLLRQTEKALYTCEEGESFSFARCPKRSGPRGVGYFSPGHGH
jgi:hypothetical protein